MYCMYCTVLYVLYCTVCTVLYCTSLHCTVLLSVATMIIKEEKNVWNDCRRLRSSSYCYILHTFCSVFLCTSPLSLPLFLSIWILSHHSVRTLTLILYSHAEKSLKWKKPYSCIFKFIFRNFLSIKKMFIANCSDKYLMYRAIYRTKDRWRCCPRWTLLSSVRSSW